VTQGRTGWLKSGRSHDKAVCWMSTHMNTAASSDIPQWCSMSTIRCHTHPALLSAQALQCGALAHCARTCSHRRSGRCRFDNNRHSAPSWRGGARLAWAFSHWAGRAGSLATRRQIQGREASMLASMAASLHPACLQAARQARKRLRVVDVGEVRKDLRCSAPYCG